MAKIKQERQQKHTPTNMNPKAPKFPSVKEQKYNGVQVPTGGYTGANTSNRVTGQY